MNQHPDSDDPMAEDTPTAENGWDQLRRTSKGPRRSGRLSMPAFDKRQARLFWIVVIAALVFGLCALGSTRGGSCVDGAGLFEADEVGSAFTFCDDDGDGDFDRQIFNG